MTTTIDISKFGITETKNFSGIFKLANNQVEIEITNVIPNPRNRRVMFGSVSDADLIKLIDLFDNKKISKSIIKHNQFAFYNHQIVK